MQNIYDNIMDVCVKWLTTACQSVALEIDRSLCCK